jgi:hypothetical protein
LCTLLCKNPLLNEPGIIEHHKDVESYNEIIEYSNLNVAVCDIVIKKQGIFLPFFENFYPYIKENFNKNYDKLLEFSQKKMADERVENKNFKTGIYNMNVNIIYEVIILKLNKAKQMVGVLSP